jgi:hypothetical protein
MSQLSYLQQIAQRTSGRFSQLMPPRSLFQNWETPMPLEISDEAPVSTQIERSPVLPTPPASQTASLANPPIQPQDTKQVSSPRLDSPTTLQAERSPEIPPATTIPTESLANLPIQLPDTTLEPSATSLSYQFRLHRYDMLGTLQRATSNYIIPNQPETISPTDPVIPTPDRVTLETSPITEITEPRNSSSLQSESLTAMAPRASQPPEPGLPSEQKLDVTENTSPPPQRTIAPIPLIAEFSNPLIEGGDRAQSPIENRPPTESPPLVRWLTPTVQYSPVEKPSPETPGREISSEAIGSPVVREQSPQGNTIRIGTIDIQILPPPVIPQPAPTSALSRGFASSFGLRQG